MTPVAGATYDLVVVGGGINGAGIARDAALRGLDVLLLEAGDFGGGTSSWSSRLIHGGLRYLEYGEISLVYESLHERRNLLANAPHLVRPLAINIPLFDNGGRPRWLVRLGMLAYDLLSIGKPLPRHRMLNIDELEATAPGICRDRLRGAARYFDAQVTYAERLVIENVIAAVAAGAQVRNYSPVTGLDVAGDTDLRVHFDDAAGGRSTTVQAVAVVNAAGPWVDRVLARATSRMPRLMGGTRGSHIVVSRFPGASDEAFYIEAVDGRPVFILPWNGLYLIGTTDIRYDGDPAEARASLAEIDYLLAATNEVFPGAALNRDSIHYAYAGIRPLPWQRQGPESAITRRHIIYRHRGSAAGLWSVIGGKLTTFRNLAEQVVDRVARQRKDKILSACSTAREPLPGGRDIDAARAALDARPALSPACRERLLRIYGGRAAALCTRLDANPSLGDYLDDRQTMLAAEVVYAIRDEYARTLTDIVHRRMMSGLEPDGAAESYAAVARLAAAELGWDASETARQRTALEAWTGKLRPPFPEA